MRYNLEEIVTNEMRSDEYSHELIKNVKEYLQEILDYRFPEYDGLRYYQNSVNYLNSSSDYFIGDFESCHFKGKICISNGKYEIKPDNGNCPRMKYYEQGFGSDTSYNYEIVYRYRRDIIVLNIHYLCNPAGFKNKLLAVAVFTNNTSRTLDSDLVPDYYYDNRQDQIDESKIDITNIPALRVFANQCCDYYHQEYTDIYEPPRNK